MSNDTIANVLCLGIGLLFGAYGAWFVTAIRWYRRGMNEAAEVWERAYGHSTAAAVLNAKDAIQTFVNEIDAKYAEAQAARMKGTDRE